jgi:hypothetical protein
MRIEKLVDPVMMLTSALGSADPSRELASEHCMYMLRKVLKEAKLPDHELAELLFADEGRVGPR